MESFHEVWIWMACSLIGLSLASNTFVKYWQQAVQSNPDEMHLRSTLALRWLQVTLEHWVGKRSGLLVSPVAQWLQFKLWKDSRKFKQSLNHAKLGRAGFHCVSLLTALGDSAICLLVKLVICAMAMAKIAQGFLKKAQSSTVHKVTGSMPENGRRVRVLFIRHAESMWNRTFNQYRSWRILPQIILTLIWAVCLFADFDSVIFDSPLSSIGVMQAGEFQAWIGSQDKEAQTILNEFLGLGTRCRLMTSNLRRAISTICIAFYGHLDEGTKVFVSNNLQESTHNPDGICLNLSTSGGVPSVFEAEAQIWDMGAVYNKKVDWSANGGNATTSVTERHQAFERELFDAFSCSGCDHFIVCGHSLYLRSFLRSRLPGNTDFPATRKKISNCGAIVFDLVEVDGTTCVIDPSTVKLVRGRYL